MPCISDTLLPDGYTPVTPPIQMVLMYETDIDILTPLYELSTLYDYETLKTIVGIIMESRFYHIQDTLIPLLYHNPICSKDFVWYFGYPIGIEINPNHLSLSNIVTYLSITDSNTIQYMEMFFNNIVDMVTRWTEETIVPITNRYISVSTRNLETGQIFLSLYDDIRTIRFYNALYYSNGDQYG